MLKDGNSVPDNRDDASFGSCDGAKTDGKMHGTLPNKLIEASRHNKITSNESGSKAFIMHDESVEILKKTESVKGTFGVGPDLSLNHHTIHTKNEGAMPGKGSDAVGEKLVKVPDHHDKGAKDGHPCTVGIDKHTLGLPLN